MARTLYNADKPGNDPTTDPSQDDWVSVLGGKAPGGSTTNAGAPAENYPTAPAQSTDIQLAPGRFPWDERNPGGPGSNNPSSTNYDPTGGRAPAFNESAFSQAWLGSGGRTPQDLANFISQHPELSQGITITGSKGDKVRLADGRVFDAVLAAGEGGKGATWNPVTGGGDGGGGGTDYNSLNDLIAHLLGQFGYGSSSLTGGGGSGPARDLINQQYAALIAENSKPVGDVSQTPQALAYANAAQRAGEFGRAKLAERAGAEGMGQGQGGAGTGGFDSDVMGMQQAEGEANSQYQAKLAEQLLTDRQNRLQTALTQYGGYLNDTDRLTLQQQLQSVTAALQMAQLAVQNTQFYDNLGYLIGNQESNLNTQAATV